MSFQYIHTMWEAATAVHHGLQRLKLLKNAGKGIYKLILHVSNKSLNIGINFSHIMSFNIEKVNTGRHGGQNAREKTHPPSSPKGTYWPKVME